MTTTRESASMPEPVSSPSADTDSEMVAVDQSGGGENAIDEMDIDGHLHDVVAREASQDGTGESAMSARSRSEESADLEREGEVAADFLESLMDITDLDGDLEVDVKGDRAAVSIVDSDEGSVPRRLVGREAAVLEALQELTRLAVQAETGERSRLVLDVGGYRAQRRQTLVKTADAAISSVRQTGEQFALDPMSAFERKVIHDEVMRAGLASESEGEEPYRFVVVVPSR